MMYRHWAPVARFPRRPRPTRSRRWSVSSGGISGTRDSGTSCYAATRSTPPKTTPTPEARHRRDRRARAAAAASARGRRAPLLPRSLDRRHRPEHAMHDRHGEEPGQQGADVAAPNTLTSRTGRREWASSEHRRAEPRPQGGPRRPGDTPAFDASDLQGRGRRAPPASPRRRAASVATAVVLVGGVAAALVTIDDTGRSTPHAGAAPTRAASASPYGGMAPGNPPPVPRHRARRDRATYRSGTGHGPGGDGDSGDGARPAVVHRHATGRGAADGRRRGPGPAPERMRRRTGPAATTAPERVAISNRVDATSPQQRILTVTDAGRPSAGSLPGALGDPVDRGARAGSRRAGPVAVDPRRSASSW